MAVTSWQGHQVGVIGLGRAGRPAALFLAAQGARVTGYDQSPREKLTAPGEFEQAGVRLFLGGADLPGIEQQQTVVLSPGIKIHQEPWTARLADWRSRGIEVISELELAARHCPTTIIAITGTKGKSTTTRLTTGLLRAAGRAAVAAGNTGIPLIAETAALRPGAYAVLEVSSFQLELVSSFRPRLGMLLNLLPDHLDYHPTLDQYWSAKFHLFARQQADDKAFFNYDDPGVRAWWQGASPGLPAPDSLQAARYITSLQDNAPGLPRVTALRAGKLGLLSGESFLPVVAVDQLSLVGKHNLANVAAALALAAHAVGIPEVPAYQSVWRETLQSFQALPHRLEPCRGAAGIRWINDSQATIPEASRCAVEAFAAPVFLIAGGLAKLPGDMYREWGRAVARHCAQLFLIGEAAPLLAQAAREGGMDAARIHEVGLLENAVMEAQTLATPGTTVLMSPACASFDQFKSFEERGQTFAALVRDLAPPAN